MDIASTANKLFEELGLQDHAEQFAQALPDKPLSLPKDKIIDGTGQYGQEEIERLEQRTLECGQILEEYQQEVKKFDHQSLASKATLDEAKRQKEKATAKLHKSEVNLRVFKEENNLQRNVLNDDRIVQLMWALVVVVGEGLLNSWFFKDGFTTGLAGGFLMAFLVSFVNVSFAFVGGVLGLRYLLNHNSAAKQLGGAFIFAFCVMICFFTVSMTAWFRGSMDKLLDEKELIGDELIFQAWNNALYHLQAFDGFAIFATLGSFLVFFVGLICAMLGLWKGYEYDDPYPGYGPLWRTVQEDQEEADEATEELNRLTSDYELKSAKIRENLLEKASALSKNKVLIKRNFFDPTTDPKNYKLDENLRILAFEIFGLYYLAMQPIVPVPSELPPIPEIDTYPGDTFKGFTVKNFNKIERLETIYSEIEEVEESVNRLKKG